MAGHTKLTWQNVSAPDFSPSSKLLSDALDMFEKTGDHLDSALDKLDAPGKRQAELAFAQNLAQYQDADSIRAAAASGALMNGVEGYRQNAAMFDKANAAAKEMEAINFQKAQANLYGAQARGAGAEADTKALSLDNNKKAQAWMEANPGVLANALNRHAEGDSSALTELSKNPDLPIGIHKTIMDNFSDPTQLSNHLKYRDQRITQERTNAVNRSIGKIHALTSGPNGASREAVMGLVLQDPEIMGQMSDPTTRSSLEPVFKNLGININEVVPDSVYRAQQALGAAASSYSPGSSNQASFANGSNFSASTPAFRNLIDKNAYFIKVGDKPGSPSLTKPDGSYMNVGEFIGSMKDTREVTNEKGQKVKSGATGYSQNIHEYGEKYIKRYFGIPENQPIPENILKEEAGPELQMGLLQLQYDELLKRNVPGSMVSQGWSGLGKIAGAKDPSNWKNVDPLLASLIIGAPENGNVNNPLDSTKKLTIGKGGDISSMEDVYALQKKLHENGILDSWRENRVPSDEEYELGGIYDEDGNIDPTKADQALELGLIDQEEYDLAASAKAASEASKGQADAPTEPEQKERSAEVTAELQKQMANLQRAIVNSDIGITRATITNSATNDRNPLSILPHKEPSLERLQQQAADIDKAAAPYIGKKERATKLLSNIPELENKVSQLLEAANLEKEVRSNPSTSKEEIDTKVTKINKLREGAVKGKDGNWYIDPTYSPGSTNTKSAKAEAALTASSKEETQKSGLAAFEEQISTTLNSRPNPEAFQTKEGAIKELQLLKNKALGLGKALETDRTISESSEESNHMLRFIDGIASIRAGKSPGGLVSSSEALSGNTTPFKDSKTAAATVLVNDLKRDMTKKFGSKFSNLTVAEQDYIIKEGVKDTSIWETGNVKAGGVAIDSKRVGMMIDIANNANLLSTVKLSLQQKEDDKAARQEGLNKVVAYIDENVKVIGTSGQSTRIYNPAYAQSVYTEAGKLFRNVLKPEIDTLTKGKAK